MRIHRRWLFGAALLLVLPTLALLWLLGTQSGTRFLVERAQPFLPEPLSLVGVSGTVLRSVSLESIEWRDGNTIVVAESVSLSVRTLPLVSRNVIIDELDIAALAVNVGDSGQRDTTAGLPEIDLPVDLRVFASSIRQIDITSPGFARRLDEVSFTGRFAGSNLRIREFSLRSSWLDITLSGDARLAGRYTSTLDAAWAWKDIPELTLSGVLELTGDVRGFRLDHKLVAPVSVASTGEVAFIDDVPDIDIENTWQTIEWPTASGAVAARDGSLRVTGTPAELALELSTLAGLQGYPEQQVALSGRATGEQLRIDSLRLQSPLGIADVSGDIAWLPDIALAIDYQLSTVDLSRVAPDVSSALAAEGAVSVQQQADEMVVVLLIDTLNGELNGFDVDGRARVRSNGDMLQLSDTRLHVGANSVELEGTLAETLAMRAAIDATRLADIVPAASGQVAGEVNLRGTRSAPRLLFDLEGQGLRWQDVASVDSITAEGAVTPDERSEASLSAYGVSIGDREFDSLQVMADGSREGHRVRSTLEGFGAEAELELEGALVDGRWSGALNELIVDSEATERWATRSAAGLLAGADSFSLERVCLYHPDQASACLSGSMNSDGESDFGVQLENLPLSRVPFPLPPELSVDGRLFASVEGRWDGQVLNAESRLDVRDGKLNLVYDEEIVDIIVSELVANATVRDNTLESSLRLGVGKATQASVSLGIDKLFNAESSVSGQTDVSVPDVSSIAALIPGIAEPVGALSGTLLLGGQLNAPVFAGDLQLRDGRFIVRAAETTVSDVNLRLTQLAPGQLQVNGSARSGEGQISVTGKTLVSTDAGVRSEFSIDGENFALARRADLSVTASPDIDIVFDDQATLISGELNIPSARIRLRDIPASATSASADAVVHREAAPETTKARRIDIDVGTSLGDDVNFSGFGLTTRFEGDVRIRGGNTQAYTGQGRVSLQGGKYKSYGQELDIEEGELIFSGPLENPRLNVRAVRRVEDIVAGIRLSGTPLQLQSTLYSEPTMTDAETLAYLLTGRPLSGAADGDDGELLNQAAFSLGLSGAGAVVSRVRSSLGLETLAIEGGGDNSRLVAGKRIGSRLLVEYGYGVVDQLGSLLLRYQLSDRVVLESRTGTVSNLDILYSVKKD